MDYKELEERLTSPKRKMDRVDFEKKLRSNKHIMETLSEEEIENYLNQGDYQAVIDIVDKVYGKEASDILRERLLTTDDIPTFNIFDSNIREVIGYGGVHTFLTYYMDSSKVIDEMVENPDLIDLYKTYKEQIGDFYPPSAIGLQDSLLTFDKYKELISEVSKVGWTNELRDNFFLRIRDEEHPDLAYKAILNAKSQNRAPQQFTLDHRNNVPHTIDELKNYRNSRDKLIAKELADAEDREYGYAQKLLIYKYFGNIRENDKYDHEYFLKDYLSFYTADFSDYEISAIYLYSIIQQTKDIDVLKQIDAALSQTEHINPLDMKSIDSKVAEIYRQEYLNSTITLDKAKRMVETHENGSYKGLLKTDGTIVCEDHILTPDGTKQERSLLQTGEIITKSTIHEKSSYEIKMDDGKTYKQSEQFQPITFTVENNNVEITVDKEGSVHESITSTINNINYTYHLIDSNLVGFAVNGEEKRGLLPLAQKRLDPILANPDYATIKTKLEPEISKRKKVASLSELFEDGQILPNDISHVSKGEQPVYFLNTTEETFFAHMERGFTSKPLALKINSTLGEEYLDASLLPNNRIDSSVISTEELYVINNFLEGGLSSISAYYNNLSGNSDWVGYVNKIHPNAIFLQNIGDGKVDHSKKKLNFPGNSTENLMEFGTSNDKLAYRNNKPGSVTASAAEVAYLRYEWDITQIKPGTKGGKVPIDFIIAGKANNENAAKYALCAGVPLVKIMSGRERHTYLEDAPRREESKSISLLRQALDQADDKKITSDEIKKASQILLKIKETELQKNDEGR